MNILERLKGESIRELVDHAVLVVPKNDEISDPRPDLGDSWLWLQLIDNALDVDRHLAWALHGFRAKGCVIENGKIRPVISDETGGWKSKEEYNSERDKWLKPHLKVIQELLGRSSQWDTKSTER